MREGKSLLVAGFPETRWGPSQDPRRWEARDAHSLRKTGGQFGESSLQCGLQGPLGSSRLSHTAGCRQGSVCGDGGPSCHWWSSLPQTQGSSPGLPLTSQLPSSSKHVGACGATLRFWVLPHQPPLLLCPPQVARAHSRIRGALGSAGSTLGPTVGPGLAAGCGPRALGVDRGRDTVPGQERWVWGRTYSCGAFAGSLVLLPGSLRAAGPHAFESGSGLSRRQVLGGLYD